MYFVLNERLTIHTYLDDKIIDELKFVIELFGEY
jgi:hypothetical protein